MNKASGDRIWIVLCQQAITKGLLFIAIALGFPKSILYMIFVPVFLLDVIFPYIFLRKHKAELGKLNKVLLSRLFAENPTAYAASDTAAVLETYLALCQTAQEDTNRLIQEKKGYSLELSGHMKDSIYTTTRINGSVLAIYDKIETLNGDIQKSLSAIQEIAGTLRSLENKIEDQSSSITQTSAAIEEMDASISNVRVITEKKETASKDLVSHTVEGKRKMEEMGRGIDSIDSNIDSIQEIIKVINHIATQTNLLSMNAAIEAAHAGSAGKGFAVVAAEIRKLSESTSGNAKLISNTLKTIIGNIKSVKDLSSFNLTSYTKITDEASLMADTFREINLAATELNAGSNEIVGATQLLKEVTISIKDGSREITESLDKIRNSIQGILSSSERSGAETSKISDVAQALNLVFLKITETFLKYEKTVSEIRACQDYETTGKKASVEFDSIPIMLQHLLWIIRARGVIDKKLDIDRSEIVDHRSCNLGKWIKNDAPAFLKEKDSFIRLEKDHETLHRIVREIIESADHLDRTLLEGKYDELLRYSETILNELVNLDRELSV